MAYTGGNAGYVRRLGRVPSTTPSAPTEPVAGYSAWFDAGQGVYEDTFGTVPATDGNPVGSWGSRGGSAGAQLHAQTGGGVSYVADGVNGQPVVQGDPSGGTILTKVQTVRGTLIGASGEHTTFVVAYWGSANNHSAAGTDSAYFCEQRVTPEMAQYAGDLPTLAAKAGDFSGQWVIVTSIASLTGPKLYVGVSDTRTASLSAGASGATTPSGTYSSLLGGLGGRAFNAGDFLAEVVFYPTELSEADRKLTEQYLASKYGITLPY